MEVILQFFIWLPFLGFILTFFPNQPRERVISGVAIITAILHLIAVIVFIAVWVWQSCPTLHCKYFVLYSSETIEIFIDYFFDATTAVFAFVGSFITTIVLLFSRFYLHRDEGFKRYFSTITFFFLSYNIVVFSGNYETFFIGWEFIGICSFLLIGFYRDRYLPVKNSLKVLSIFRLGDISLILVMWMGHHLWHQNITFSQLTDYTIVSKHILNNGWYATFVGVMIVLAAVVKSAQFPFSSWVPRAMEGPTTSSAIFYGSLSVHLGVFLLLRAYPYWHNIYIVNILVICIGLITSVVAITIAKVQSSVKAQIAYSSIAQIGLMFIEVALELHTLVLFHFAGNAILRTYQLLVSPTVMSYAVHEMFFHFKPTTPKAHGKLLTMSNNTIYMLALKEWNMDSFLKRLLWNPFKWCGNKVAFIPYNTTIIVLVVLCSFGLYVMNTNYIPTTGLGVIAIIYSLLGLLFTTKALSERSNAIHAWLSIISALMLIVLSVAIQNRDFNAHQILLMLSGILVSAITGYICLHKVKVIDNDTSLNYYHGHTYEYKRMGFIFLLSCLGIVGLPFTPTFIGIDIMFSHVHKYHVAHIIFLSLSFMIMEISVLRIYSRFFTGMHKRTYHAMAYRSS